MDVYNNIQKFKYQNSLLFTYKYFAKSRLLKFTFAMLTRQPVWCILSQAYCSEGLLFQDFGLKDMRLSSKRVPSCYITVWTEFAIAKYFCSHIRGALDIIVYFKGFKFAAFWLGYRRIIDFNFITWLSFILCISYGLTHCTHVASPAVLEFGHCVMVCFLWNHSNSITSRKLANTKTSVCLQALHLFWEHVLWHSFNSSNHLMNSTAFDQEVIALNFLFSN